MLPFETTERSEWAYLRFGPHTGVEFRHANGNQYEMVLVRNAKLDYLQGVFLTFPDINEWPTKDLYSKHPSKADHWHYECRADDIIVFNNGEKVNPLTMQQAISNHPDIAGALVAGSGRFQSSLILEPLKPVKSAVDREALVEKVWPTIQRANEECVAHGRVDRDFILFTDPGRPFLRAGKGTIQRNLSIQLYKDEIEALYKAMSAVEPSSVQVDLSDASSVRSSLRAVISATAGSEPLADDADFFTHGVDSVHVIRLVRFVNKALGGSVITSQGVYSNGSINRLTDLVMKHKDLGNQEPEMNRIANMNHIFDKYASDIPISARVVSNSTEVILTGSTGSLGSYILHRLLETPSIHHIHCFNRTVDAKDRQTHSKLHLSLLHVLPTSHPQTDIPSQCRAWPHIRPHQPAPHLPPRRPLRALFRSPPPHVPPSPSPHHADHSQRLARRLQPSAVLLRRHPHLRRPPTHRLQPALRARRSHLLPLVHGHRPKLAAHGADQGPARARGALHRLGRLAHDGLRGSKAHQ